MLKAADGKSPAAPQDAESTEGLAVDYPVALRIRNTFIDTSSQRSPSLEAFYREREVSTCPSSHIGRLTGLFDRMALGPGPQEVGSPSERQHATAQAALPTGAGPSSSTTRILSLAEALGGAPEVWAGERPAQPGPPAVGLPSLGGGGKPPPFAGVAAERRAELGLPSAGSAGHWAGLCKPCAFVHTSGCAVGRECQFCHVCEPGEKKRRRKEKLERIRATRRLRAAARQ